jgi:hypothetical protein
MKALILEATDYTPHVVLDPVSNQLEINGESSPEDAIQFYSAVGKWFKEYSDFRNERREPIQGSTEKPLVLTFYLTYITSSSLRCIYDLLRNAQLLPPFSSSLRIKWKHDFDDADIASSGMQLSKMLNLPFEIVSI